MIQNLICRFCGQSLVMSSGQEHKCEAMINAEIESALQRRPSIDITVRVSQRLSDEIESLAEMSGEDAQILIRLALQIGMNKVRTLYPIHDQTVLKIPVV